MQKAVNELPNVQKIQLYLFCIDFPTTIWDFHYLPLVSRLPIETVLERAFITTESAKGWWWKGWETKFDLANSFPAFSSIIGFTTYRHSDWPTQGTIFFMIHVPELILWKTAKFLFTALLGVQLCIFLNLEPYTPTGCAFYSFFSLCVECKSNAEA